MVQISPCIIPSRTNANGEIPIRIKITNVNTTAYITTPYCVSSQSQFINGRVTRHSMAREINAKLNDLLSEYDELLLKFLDDRATASEIRSYLVKPPFTTELFSDFTRHYIEKLSANGQKSYSANMGYTLKHFEDRYGKNVRLSHITTETLQVWEKFLFDKGNSSTTVNIRMTHLKAILNAAVNSGMVEYKIFPFRNYRMPAKTVRDICISKDELVRLRDCDIASLPKNKCASKDSTKRLTVARDLFMLSFYCAGINLTDLYDADVTGDVLTFVRKKTADKKQGEKQVSITIQPEARAIINKYLKDDGKFDFGYRYRDYEQFRSFVTKSLNRIGEILGFEKRLMFYSARKTFCQFGYEIGVPLYVLEYAIGQTIKDANNRPIFNYIKIMRKQADEAIRAIIDHSQMLESD